MNIKKHFETLKTILNNMEEDHVGESAAQCAYYVILSFIPFIILLLTLIQYINIEPQQLIDIISNIIPANMNEMVVGVIREVYSKSIGTISISLIFTLFAADRGLFALMKELHLIYNFSDSKNKPWIYLKLISLVQTIIFIIIVAFGLVIMVFGNTIVNTVKESFGILENYTIFAEIMTQLWCLLITFIIFLCVYKFMSRHKLNLLKQIRGAIFASIALNVISFIFSKYLEIFRGFSTTYGSLTALMLIMMWIYTCFYIIFLGAEINKFYNKKI
jgi:membrane protein